MDRRATRGQGVGGDVLDPAALRSLAEQLGTESARRFARTFADQIQARILRVQGYVLSHNAERALDAALTLRVTAQTIGGIELLAVSHELERLIRAENWADAVDTLVWLRQSEAPLTKAVHQVLGEPGQSSSTSTAARPASSRATGTRKGEHDT